ncbi:MAG: hypothetical protein Q8Q06_00765 [bacterium]|nr:hypothetical protein [bacterium]
MRRINIRKTLWQCETCKTKYRDRGSAQKCEAKPIEQKLFKIGDTVRNAIEPRHCQIHGKWYRFTGKIIKILGPKPPDEEYEIKCLSSRGLHNHVFEYQVEFKCPYCQETRKELYYAPELTKIPPNSKPLKMKTMA